MDLKDKVAIVTGGASGIGEEICLQFAREGARIAIADIDSAASAEVITKIEREGGRAIALNVDIRDLAEVRKATQQVLDGYGTVDILVNCAGYNKFVGVDEVTSELWDQLISINLTGSWNFANAVMAHMRQQRSGKIINIGSAAAILANPKCLPYVVAKHGVVGLTRALAVDLGPDQITVNCICPGPIQTPLFDKSTTPEFARRIKERVPLNRLGKPSDIANAAVFFASPKSDFISGTVLPVDGGLVCCIRSQHYE